jgi:hypothetical protein
VVEDNRLVDHLLAAFRMWPESAINVGARMYALYEHVAENPTERVVLLEGLWVGPASFLKTTKTTFKDTLRTNLEDRSKGLSSSCQPSFCSSLGLFKAGQGLLAF